VIFVILIKKLQLSNLFLQLYFRYPKNDLSKTIFI